MKNKEIEYSEIKSNIYDRFIDMNEDPQIAQAIFLEYVDRLEIKIKDFIKQFMEYEN